MFILRMINQYGDHIIFDHFQSKHIAIDAAIKFSKERPGYIFYYGVEKFVCGVKLESLVQ
jgi:hypothetical protein